MSLSASLVLFLKLLWEVINACKAGVKLPELIDLGCFRQIQKARRRLWVHGKAFSKMQLKAPDNRIKLFIKLLGHFRRN